MRWVYPPSGRVTTRQDGDGPAIVEVDLAQVTFLDAAGVGTLVAVCNRARAHRVRLRVRGATGLVSQVLEVCGVEHMLGAKADA